jgi:hypothetical protein
MAVELLSPEAKERIEEKAMLDNKYQEICKQVSAGRNNDKVLGVVLNRDNDT